MYDVFISYSRADYQDKSGNVIPGNPVSRVMEAFNSAGISYWFDNQCLDHGDDFAEKIVTNIESSDIFVFLSTVNSNKSPWTRKEIASAHQFGKKIIPVKIDGSHYDKVVMFRIVDLDYIDYGRNPDKALEELVDTISGLLSEKRETERRRKEEEERRNREREQARKKAIADIELQSERLKNEVFRLKLDHKQLLLDAQRIEDGQERSRLMALVQDSFQLEDDDKEAEKALEATVRSLSEENTRLKEEVERLKTAPSIGPRKDEADDGRKMPALIKVLVIIAMVVSFLLATAFLMELSQDESYIMVMTLVAIFALVATAGLWLVLKKKASGFYIFSIATIVVGVLMATTEEYLWSLPILALALDAAAFVLLKLPIKGVKTWDLLK